MHLHSLVRRSLMSGAVPCVAVLALAPWASAKEGLESSASGAALASVESLPVASAAAGALVDVTLKSRVGVVLDEIPLAQRAAAASYYLSRPKRFWKERAVAQTEHTSYRFTYREFYYDVDPPKLKMALAPKQLWRVELASGGARRVTTADGHDAIVVDYTLTSTILADAASVAAAEPELAQIGGVWDEPFNLPLDPEFLFQRTGYACIDEDGYPLRTADSENARQLFDQECGVEGPGQSSCHYTEFPNESCLRALKRHVGRIDTSVHFERVPYRRARADAVRISEYTQTGFPDLAVLGENLDNNRITYRYIAPDSCAVQEGCVSGSGWRRLLMYDASIKNASTVDLTVGLVDESSPFVEHNVFEFSACHEHYHYSHYGDFRYGALPGDKRAFCIESTDRYYNSEETPLTHPYGCENQGIASGWGDTYIAGVECNWIDITDLAIPASGTTETLEFRLNPDDFICEGEPVTDENGEQLFTPSGEIGENGEPIDRPLCEFFPGYEQNNLGQRQVSVPEDGGFITGACTRNQAGPLRDCGFKERAENVSCRPGRSVRLQCKTGPNAAPQAMRVCENSAGLGGVTACMYREALASEIIGSTWTDVRFTCPAARDDAEPGGSYGYFTAPVLPMDSHQPITCRAL